MKFLRVSHDRTVAGGLFDDAGPATVNAQSTKLVFERETWRSPCAAEWSRRTRSVLSVWSIQNSLRWPGAVPWTALKTRRQSLYPTCSDTCSQWSLLCSRPDTGFPLYFGIKIQGLFKDFQGPWSCIFKDQFSTEVYSMNSVKATCNIYFCNYGTVLVDKNKTWQLLANLVSGKTPV